MAKESRRFRWSAVPAARSSEVVLRARLRLVLGVLFFSAAAGVFSLFAWIGNQPPPPPEVPPTPEAVAFATTAAYDWLSGEGTSLPVAENVSADLGGSGVPISDVEGVAWSSFEPRREGKRQFEIHQFTLTGPVPRQLAVTVELTSSGPVLAADPAYVPFTDVGGSAPAADRSLDEEVLDVTSAVSAVASDWAEAYAADNRERLRELTGDLEERVYVGLGGLESEGASVQSAVDAGDGMWLIRVEAVFMDGAWSSRVAYDLLVVDPETASPKIVAWGAPGDGPRLRPFDGGVRADPNGGTTTTTSEAPAAGE